VCRRGDELSIWDVLRLVDFCTSGQGRLCGKILITLEKLGFGGNFEVNVGRPAMKTEFHLNQTQKFGS
jgi:hypothetical protein